MSWITKNLWWEPEPIQGKGLNDIMAEVEAAERGAKQQEISGQWGRGNGTA